MVFILALAGTIGPIPQELAKEMQGTTYHDGCPVPLSDLRLVEVKHKTPDGKDAEGLLVVHEEVAADMAKIFDHLYSIGFPIASMRPASAFGGSDARSMDANNTSAFNCRKSTTADKWSEHSFGKAIDINPLWNPYVRGTGENRRVLPPSGGEYVDRDDIRPGMMVSTGPVVKAFRDAGWKWGGAWTSLKDYQHFSVSGN